MKTIPALLSGTRSATSLLVLAGALLLQAGEAAAAKWQYCVSNSASTHGLYTNDVYYSPQCDASSRDCISREHYFSWLKDDPTTPAVEACASTLTIDTVAGTALLQGKVKGNKNTMVVGVDISLGVLHRCQLGSGGDLIFWNSKWGKTPVFGTTSGTDPLAKTWWCADTINGQFGKPGESMYQTVNALSPPGILQFGVGANGISKTSRGGYVKFPVTVGSQTSNKTWELGMSLSLLKRLNDTPVTTVDSVATTEDTAVSICPATNDTDPDGDTLTVAVSSAPGNGTLGAVDSAGCVLYTPKANWSGSDSFGYQVSDGAGGTASGTVSITVTPVNDAPVAVDDPAPSLKARFRVKQDSTTPLMLGRADLVNANDYDVDNEPSELVINGYTQPANGTVAQMDGGLTYKPDVGSSGEDTFTYTVSDPAGATSNSATVTVTVTPIFKIVNCPTDSVDQGDNEPGTVNRNDCVIDWLGDGSFLTSFNDEPDIKGRIELDGVYDIEDPRAHCGGTPPDPDEDIVDSVNGVTLRQTWGAASGVPASTELPGLEVTPLDVDTGTVRIPWYICGMPNLENGGKPVFRLINARSDFLAESAIQDTDFRDIVNSVVEHEVDKYGSVNPEYECKPDDISNVDPLIAWLPRNDEMPYVAGSAYAKEGQVRDITTGCASVRGGALTRSYLLKDLIYFSGVTGTNNPGFRAIVRSEIDDLEQTLLQPGRAFAEDGTRSSCVVADQNIISNVWPQPEKLTGGSLLMEKIRTSFDAGDYASVLSRLDGLLTELRAATTANNKGGGLWSAFDTCYFKDDKIWNLPDYAVLDSCSVDPETGVETCPTYPPPGSGFVPRNFRGDLEAQVLHLQWNIRHKLLGQPVPWLAPIE